MKSEFAKIVAKSTLKRRISTGAAEYTSPNGAEKSGGAVAKEVKTNQDANSKNILGRSKKRTSWKRLKSWKDKHSKRNLSVNAAAKLDIGSRTARGTPILRLTWT